MTSTANGTKPKLTEAQVLSMLRERHVRHGNGGSGEFAFMTHVRNAAGFNSTRTFDAVVMSLWPSRGMELHAYEVKCSRSDWLRELKEPEKADAAAKLVDRFSMVVSDESIIQPGELPPTWGLLAVRGSKLVCVKEAPLLPEADPKRPVGRQFVIAMLRAGGAVPQAEAEEIRLARAEGFNAGVKSNEDAIESWRTDRDNYRLQIQEFERASGVSLTRWHGNRSPAEIGAALKAVLDGEARVGRVQQDLTNARDRLREAADSIDRMISAGGASDVA